MHKLKIDNKFWWVKLEERDTWDRVGPLSDSWAASQQIRPTLDIS